MKKLAEVRLFVLEAFEQASENIEAWFEENRES
ncbi:hypothetical protein BH23ACT4_BH23ACT4_13580 [soil metagenome]